METTGTLVPETADDAREWYGYLGPAARTAVRETTRAMGFDREEYDERVTPAVIETARDALFASLLVVHVGDREAFEAFCDERDFEVVEHGSEHVDHVAWHAAPAAGTIVAATYQDEEDAAVDTLRRQAFGGVYRELIEE